MDKRLIPWTLSLLLGLVAAPARGDVNSGLAAWWRFEGNFNDSAGINHGTPKGDTKITADAERGQVLELDGTGDYVEVPNSPSLSVTGSQITVAAWTWSNAVSSQPQILVGKVYRETTHVDPYFSYSLQILANGQPAIWLRLGTANRRIMGTTGMIQARRWYHLVGVYTGAQMILYLDGKVVATGSYTGDLPAYNTVLRLGTNGGFTEQVAGKMDDVRIYNRALSAEEVAAVMQGAGSLPGSAVDPTPAVEAADVPTDAVLSWTAGKFAATHDVYFGTTPADVNSASRTNPKGVLVSQGQADTSFDPAGLFAFGQIYYWRVDEVNQAPDNTIFRGDIWSFTVEPYGYPVKPVAATASSAQVNMGPEKTIDGSGLDKNDLHGTEGTTMWLSTGVQPNWIQYQFDKVYQLYDLKVWNSNQVIESYVGFGARKVTIEYSVDGTAWTTLADVLEFVQAPGTVGSAANTPVSLGGIMAKYVKLTINSTWSSTSAVAGLSEVRFSYVPVQARQPQPAAAATGVSVDATLSWRPGREAASHKVFFGTDRTAVADGTVAATTVSDHRWAPGSLSFGTTYYWRVDEVNAVTYPGDVWSFTTQEYRVVDDFESYTDKADAEVYTTWVDGYDNPAKNGGLVGLPNAVNGTFCETTIVYGGKQSMPFAYDNTKAPLSEATRTLDDPQDWSEHGITTLVLFFRGDSANTAAPIYVKINGTKVLYNNGAPSTTLPLWKQWNIDLTSLGASVRNVRTLTIGAGNGSVSEAGTIWIDEIRLYATPPQAIAAPTDPGRNGLAAWWQFEGDFQDSAGTNHGTAKGDAKIVADAPRGQVLTVDGTGDYVEVPHSPSLHLTGNTVSMAAWANVTNVTAVQMIVCKVFSNTTHVSPYFSYGLHMLANGQPRAWISRTGGAAYQAGATGMFKAGTWHHVAGVYDGVQLKLYFDGVLAGASNVTGNLVGYETVLRMGANGALTEMLSGKLDDVRIYNRALSEAEVRYLVGER